MPTGFSASVALVVGATACGPTDPEVAYYENEAELGAEPGSVASATIDVDRSVDDTREGKRVAAFVEYEREGTWFVGVTCDTDLWGYRCDWDIIVESVDGAPVFRVIETDLERSDLVLVDAGAARLLASTTDDLDGFSFRATQGVSLRVDVFLDGAPHSEFLEWMGDGALHLGAPTNPVELVPQSD